MLDPVPVDAEGRDDTEQVAFDPAGAVAIRILEAAGEGQSSDLIHVSASERRAEEIAALFKTLAVAVET